MHRCMHFQLTTPCLAFTILEYRILYQQGRRSKETDPYLGYQQYVEAVVQVFCKKDVLRNFTKLTGEHLCQRLFFNKVAGGA